MSLKLQIVNSIKWQVGATVGQKIVSFGVAIILARYLGPSVFGLFGLTLVVMGSFELFKSIGIDTALMREKDNFEKAANTAFIIIPLLGVALFLLLNLSAPYIGRFLNNQELVPIIRIIGIVFVISCFARVPAVLLERDMKFRELSIVEFVASVLFSIVALILAFMEYGVWSLVYAYIIKTLVNMVMVWTYAKWKPSFEFDKKIVLKMFNFGKYILLSSVVWFLKMNLDNFLVGKLLGITMLGYYAVAFNISNFLADYFGSKVYRVTYPAYSFLQDSIGDLRTAFLKTLKYVSIVAIPFGVGIILLGGDFLKLAYGEKWFGATGVLKILALGGIFNTLPASLGALLLACGKARLTFWITLFQVAIFFVFIAPMVKIFGLNGVGIVVSISGFIAFLVGLVWVMKFLFIDTKQILFTLRPSLFSSLLMGIAVIFLKYILAHSLSGIKFYYNFIILLFFAIAIYGFSLLRIERIIFREIKEMIL